MDRKALLISDKLELRLPDVNFAEDLFQIVDRQRAYLGEWLPWVQETKSVVDSFAFLKTSRLFNKGGQKLVTFIFYEERMVGSVALVKISKENKSAELGYWLSQEMQGQGIVTQSCLRLLEYVFKKMDLNRIEINVISSNQKSLLIPKKLGFQSEGILREGIFLKEKFHDLERFSLLKKEWNKIEFSSFKFNKTK